ncbi:methyl-accepting chemotaxis protein [Paenibacillus albidus]|uniref:methyl-accepting chemotaxis protein n=1 Tax=Paenibacillus albidus TaxID=2041023 RepID=UPI001BEB362B|nr:methyl-accepting chemotaxis protein [Paenibacillus albidus]MBT2288335.1 methyl-accepting chemotaxis protein [Paenibacillus albidus]
MKNLKVKQKMAVFMIVVMVMLTVTGVIGILTTDNMSNRSKEMYNQNLLPIALMTQIRANNQEIESFLLEILLAPDPAHITELGLNIQLAIAENDNLLFQLKENSFSNTKVAANMNEYLSLLSDYRIQRDSILHLEDKNLNTEAYEMYSGEMYTEARKKMGNLLDSSINLALTDAGVHNNDAVAEGKRFKLISSLLILGAAMFCMATGVWITRLITGPLQALQGLMKHAEEGDLTAIAAVPIAKDEASYIKISYNNMLQSLRGILRRVLEIAGLLSASSLELSASAEQTTRISERIAKTSSKIAAGFEEQAAVIGRTSQAVQVMSEEITAAQNSSQEMSRLMGVAGSATSHGAAAAELMIARMKEIDSSVSESRQIVSGLGLLSGEIGKLAEATGRSSLQITDMITSIQEQTAYAVRSMAAGSGLVLHGVEQSEQVSRAFAEIESSIQDAARQTDKIRGAIQQVSREAAAVSEAIEEMQAISHKGTAGIQNTQTASQEQLSAMSEMSASAQYLAVLAEDLQKSLASFRL